MVSNLLLILIILAIGAAITAEILVSFEKNGLKRLMKAQLEQERDKPGENEYPGKK